MKRLEVSGAVRLIYRSLSVKRLICRYSCRVLMKLEFLSAVLRKMFKYYMTISPVGAELFRADGRTDGQTGTIL